MLQNWGFFCKKKQPELIHFVRASPQIRTEIPYQTTHTKGARLPNIHILSFSSNPISDLLSSFDLALPLSSLYFLPLCLARPCRVSFVKTFLSSLFTVLLDLPSCPSCSCILSLRSADPYAPPVSIA